MKINYQFNPFKFKNPDDFFSKPDSYILSFPNEEPMGFLKTTNGHHAYIEFVFEDPELIKEESIGSQYKGSGIYLLDYAEKATDKYIPFWVVLQKNQALTVGKVKKILNQIEDILLKNEYLNKNVWEHTS